MKVSFHQWFDRQEHGSAERCDLIWEAGRKAVSYAQASGWWEWSGGSGILFWRWPKIYQDEMREGVPPYFVGPPPSSTDRQPPYSSDLIRSQVLEKVESVTTKGYIEITLPSEVVKSTMYMFHVPKGLDDVRMVYDGSKSGLNESLFAPWFHIHSVEMMCRSLLPEYWCGDNDYGEQFLNFNLHPTLQQYCFVDLTQLMGKRVGVGRAERSEVFGRWTRCAMGLRPSPYAAVKGALIARRLILGDRHDHSNPFHWSAVRLNQPGDIDYQSNLPWIMQVRHDGDLAVAVCQYIDDLRTCARDERLAWRASSRIGKVLGFLGLQDAARKRREPSQTPGAWSGATVTSDKDNVFQSVTNERWEKTQRHIRWVAQHVGLRDELSVRLLSEEDRIGDEALAGYTKINHKRLESVRGFLVYVAGTFKAMVPYLKGIHLTLDSWRPNRDSDGWKLSFGLRGLLPEESGDNVTSAPPAVVQPATRLRDDLIVLMLFTQ